MNMKQSDCRFGGVGFAAGEDLSLKAGCLVKLNSGGDLVLPSAASDITPYVVICGADTGYLCGAVPLTSSGNCRIKLSGTCEAGDLLVSKGDGRVEKGTELTAGLNIGTAEEAGVDGQLVLLRPMCVGSKGADGADGEDGAPGAPGGTGPAGATGPAGTGLTIDAVTASVAGGAGATATGSAALAMGASAAATGSGAAVYGANGVSAADEACVFGFGARANGADSTAVGAYAYAVDVRGVAVGNATKAAGEGRVELAGGYPTYSYGRISLQKTGSAMFTCAPAAPAAYGYADFDNADGTMPLAMWTAGLNGDGSALLFYVNVAGTIKTGTLALT